MQVLCQDQRQYLGILGCPTGLLGLEGSLWGESSEMPGNWKQSCVGFYVLKDVASTGRLGWVG